MAMYESTLCWECQNTNRHKCSWFNPDNPQPVPGWVAEFRPIRVGHTPQDDPVESYLVRECPNFEPVAPPSDTRHLTIPGVYWRREQGVWVAHIIWKRKHYYLGRFSDQQDAIAARRAAEEAIERGEAPLRKK